MFLKFLKNYTTFGYLFNLLFTRTCPCCPLPPEAVCDAGPEVAGPGVPSLAPTGPASEVTVAADKPPANLYPRATGSRALGPGPGAPLAVDWG